MNLLLVLLSVMTFTVQTKSSVSASGEYPYDIGVEYSCNYQKGTVRAGDVAAFRVWNLDGITVEKIEVYVRSNKSSGAGTFTVRTYQGTVTLATLSGSFNQWTGQWDNQEYHAITLVNEQVKNVYDISIQLIGSENSLYIEKYVITWSSPAESYNVTLKNGDQTLETLHGMEVVLPSLEDLADWKFVGWTDVAFEHEWALPGQLIPAGKYKPAEDETLWAVYESIIPIEMYFAKDLSDGIYLYADSVSGTAMSGSVLNGVAGSTSIDREDTNQMYEVTFDTDGMATIQRAYIYSEEYIGFSGTQLANTPSKWNVYHEGSKTAFYTTVGTKTYMLHPGWWKEKDAEFYTQLLEVIDLTTTPTVLIDVEGLMASPLYTCYPERKEDVETVNCESMNREWIIPIGQYDLIIKDGRKYLRRR